MSKLTNPPQHFISQKTYLAFYFIVDFVDEQINKPKSTSMFYLPKSLCLLFFKEFFFQHFRDALPLNTVSGLLDLSLFWLLLVTGSLILFVWTFGNKLLVIFHTQVNLFSIAGPVYRSIIEPYFNYCSLVLDGAGKTQSNKLQHVQNRAAHIVTGLPYAVWLTQRLELWGWSSLTKMRMQQKAVMMYRVILFMALLHPIQQICLLNKWAPKSMTFKIPNLI